MITQKELKELLDYDPNTGVFTWKETRSGGCIKGKTAGSLKKDTGYIVIRINRREYQAHRLAYLFTKGYFPEYQVDHRDGIRSNNKWENLRHVTRVCNLQNTKVYSSNKSGFPGVCWNKACNKWKAYIMINQRSINLGHYDDVLEAALARFTVESQCYKWTCNYRSELVQAIERAWPEFKINR